MMKIFLSIQLLTQALSALESINISKGEIRRIQNTICLANSDEIKLFKLIKSPINDLILTKKTVFNSTLILPQYEKNKKYIKISSKLKSILKSFKIKSIENNHFIEINCYPNIGKLRISNKKRVLLSNLPNKTINLIPNLVHNQETKINNQTSQIFYEITNTIGQYIQIEHSICRGKLEYKIYNNSPSNNDFNSNRDLITNYYLDSSGGRTTIFVNNTKISKLYFVIKPLDSEISLCKNNINNCESKTIHYYIKYSLRKGRIHYETENNDFSISDNSIYNGSSIFQWKPLKIVDEGNNYSNFKVEYEILITNQSITKTQMNSICFLQEFSSFNRYFTETNSIDIEKSKDSRSKYIINILAKITHQENKFIDFYAYNSIEIEVDKSSAFTTALSIVVIVFIVYSGYYLYKKYNITKKKMDYELVDFRKIGLIEMKIDTLKTNKLSENSSSFRELKL